MLPLLLLASHASVHGNSPDDSWTQLHNNHCYKDFHPDGRGHFHTDEVLCQVTPTSLPCRHVRDLGVIWLVAAKREEEAFFNSGIRDSYYWFAFSLIGLLAAEFRFTEEHLKSLHEHTVHV